jgi:hypothetical protein
MKAAAVAFSGNAALSMAHAAGRLGQRLFERDGQLYDLPGPLRAWTKTRDLPALPKESFRQWWASRRPPEESESSSAAGRASGGGAPRPAGNDGRLHPVQQGFWECHGAQCGFCTPGMIMAAVQLLERTPSPSRAEIADGLRGNLCRCTGYSHIIDAVEHASRRR